MPVKRQAPVLMLGDRGCLLSCCRISAVAGNAAVTSNAAPASRLAVLLDEKLICTLHYPGDHEIAEIAAGFHVDPSTLHERRLNGAQRVFRLSPPQNFHGRAVPDA